MITNWWRMLSHTPSRRKARMYPYTVRQGPPLTAGAHEVEQPVQQVPYVRGSRAPAGLGGRDQRLQQAKLVIRQGLAGAKISNQHAISRRPHDGLQAENRMEPRQDARDQHLISGPSLLIKRA